MARIYISSVIEAPAARVWERVRDFNGMPRWHPRIRDSRIENGEPSDRVGCVRDFHLQNGDHLREKLLALSDFDMFQTYCILESPMPLTDYVATLRLTPVTDGDRHLWRVDGRVQLRVRGRGGVGQRGRHERLPGRLRRAETATGRVNRTPR